MAKIDDQALRRIAHRIVGQQPGLYLPWTGPRTPQRLGTRWVLLLGHQDLRPGGADANEFLAALRTVPMPAGIVALSAVNLAVSRLSHLDPTHGLLNQRFLSAERLEQVQEAVKALEPPLPDAVHVFSRVTVLLLERLVLAVSSQTERSRTEPEVLLGDLALFTNDYIAGGELRHAKQGEEVDYLTLLVEMLPTWDIVNPPDLAYGLSRAYRLMQVHLLDDDPIVADLRGKLPLDFGTARFDGLPIDDYVGCILGLYAWHDRLDLRRILAGPGNSVLDTSTFWSAVGFPSGLFRLFLDARSRTIQELQPLVFSAPVITSADLRAKLETDAVLADTMALRQRPLCRLDDTHAVCLDVSFLAELLIHGLYWRILEQLPKKQDGDLFLSLWGRLFELYLIEQLSFHYPSSMSPLRVDVHYEGGQVDALLDFGEDLILFEFKGSLLKAQAKYDRNVEAFKNDFALKFVENEKGDPKALRQLALSSSAAVKGHLELSMVPKCVFPVLVGYEMALDAFWVNRYADEVFATLLEPGLRPKVQPLSAMSAEAFEIAITYASAGDITWMDLLRRRFSHGKASDLRSVYQVIHDWRSEDGVPNKRNQFIKKDFDLIFERALGKYKPGAQSSAAAAETEGPT